MNTRRADTQSARNESTNCAIWLMCVVAALLGIADASASDASALEAQRGDARNGEVAWHAGIVAAPNGLIVDSRAATLGSPATATAKSTQAAKALINPRAMSGQWFDPAQDGHGFNFTFVERPGQNDLFVVAWYVYRNGAQVWVNGAGEITGNTATAQVVVTSGGQFPPLFNAASVSRVTWGTIAINVIACDRIAVAWQPVVAGYTAGSLIAQPIAIAGGSGAAACQVTGGGGGGGGDDHGNSCAAASSAAAPGSVAGAINPAGDEDFFRVNLGSATTLTAQSSGIATLDPFATLFDANCNALVEDDDSGGGLNFRISRAVSAGTYFLRVRGFGSTTGTYNVSFSTSGGSPPPGGTSVTLAFTNRLIYPMIVRANGTTLGQVPASATAASQTLTVSGPLDVTFEMVRPTTPNGTPVGDPVTGSFSTISMPSGTIPLTFTNVFGTTQIFAPLVNNNTAASLLMGVNMGLQSENRCNCTVPAFQQNTGFGYYRLFSNSNVRGYRDSSGYTGPFIFWNVSSAESQTGIVRLTANFAP